jgi:hypothetical protein
MWQHVCTTFCHIKWLIQRSNSLIVLTNKFSKEQCMLPEDYLRTETCRSVLNVLMWISMCILEFIKLQKLHLLVCINNKIQYARCNDKDSCVIVALIKNYSNSKSLKRFSWKIKNFELWHCCHKWVTQYLSCD